jgi:hypothetical protein
MLYQIKNLLPVILLVATTSACKNDNNNEDAKKYIINAEAQWAESVATNDTSFLHKILADDFIWVLDGIVWNKKMAIDGAKNGPGDFISDHLDSAFVRFYDNTAVVAGSETWTKKHPDGTTFSGKFIWTDTWIKRNGVWQAVQAQDITIPSTPK